MWFGSRVFSTRGLHSLVGNLWGGGREISVVSRARSGWSNSLPLYSSLRYCHTRIVPCTPLHHGKRTLGGGLGSPEGWIEKPFSLQVFLTCLLQEWSQSAWQQKIQAVFKIIVIAKSAELTMAWTIGRVFSWCWKLSCIQREREFHNQGTCLKNAHSHVDMYKMWQSRGPHGTDGQVHREEDI